MPREPRNLAAGLELLDSAARTVGQAGNELRQAHIEIGNCQDFTVRMLDLYVDIDRLHASISELMADARARTNTI